jgi:hypothetical protein
MTETIATHWTGSLIALNACHEAVMWASTYDSLDAAWVACERADWMLWLIGRVSGPPESDDRKRLVLCACACARTALRHTTDARVLACIETAERWTRCEATIADVKAARREARNAADADADADAAYAADDADADYAAADADADAAYAAARSQSLREMAALVREHYPTAPVMGGVQ